MVIQISEHWGLSVTSLSLDTIASLCQLYSVYRSFCNQLYSLPVVLPRWLVDLLYPEMPFSTLCQSFSAPRVCFWLEVGSFLLASSSPPSVFLFTSSDLPSSHCHSFPHPPLRTSKLISPSCRAEFHYSACLYPSACLSGFPQMGPPTPCWCWSPPCRCTCLGVATDTRSFVFLVSRCISIAGCSLTFQPYMRLFSPEISWCVGKYLSPCVFTPLSHPKSECFSYASLVGNTSALKCTSMCPLVLSIPLRACSPLRVSPDIYTYTITWIIYFPSCT